MTIKTDFVRSSAVIEVKDVVASAAFYKDKLGFETASTWGEPPCFCIVGRGAVTLFLDQRREAGAIPLNQYWAAYVYIDDVVRYEAELRGRGVEIIRGPETTFYGIREIDVRDPDGHIICFGQDLTPSPHGPGL